MLKKNNSDSTFLSKHNTFTLEAEWQTILNIKILNIIIKGAFSNLLALESLFFTPPYIDMNYHDISEYYANYKKNIISTVFVSLSVHHIMEPHKKKIMLKYT